MHYTHEDEESRRAEIDAAKATMLSAEALSKSAGPVGSLCCDALVRAQCLTALISHPEIREWVKTQAVKPGRGGAIHLWTQLACEYAEALSRPNT